MIALLASTNLKTSAQKCTTEDAEDTEEAMGVVWRFPLLRYLASFASGCAVTQNPRRAPNICAVHHPFRQP